jgi:hypothetical protein
MSVPGESHHPFDIVILHVDIDDCPVAELPAHRNLRHRCLSPNSEKDDYLTTSVTHQLEDTTWWLEDQSVSPLFDAGFATYHRRPQTADPTVICCLYANRNCHI